MKIVIVGTGSIGRRHIESVLKTDPTASFFILRADRRHDALVGQLSATVVASVEEAMALQPDCAIIATPSAMHTSFILDFIKYGLAMYIEKPVVILRHDVNKIRSHIKQYDYKSTTIVGCNLRFLKSLQIIKEMIQKGELGDIARADFQAGQWLPDWRPQQDYRKSYSADPVRGGGVLWDLIHELDSVRYLMGDFDQVKAMTSLFKPLEISSDSIATLLLAKSEGGPLVTVGLDYVARRPVRKYEIYGEDASLIWDLSNTQLQKHMSDGVEIITDNPEDFDVSQTYIDAMQEFLEAVKAGSATTQDIEEGLKSAELAVLAKEQV